MPPLKESVVVIGPKDKSKGERSRGDRRHGGHSRGGKKYHDDKSDDEDYDREYHVRPPSSKIENDTLTRNRCPY